jgi:rod shape-determining protein MreC
VHLNFRRPHYITLGVMVLLTVVILKLPGRTASQIKLAVSGLFLPLFGLAGSANQVSEKADTTVLPRKELVQERDRLRRENAELRVRITQAEEIARENNRLRQQLGAARQFPWRVAMARVVSRDPANWWRTVKIDLGLRQGVSNNCPVVSAEGSLVGRVSEVGFTQSQVALVGDPDCRVSVMIEETRDSGVIAPSSSNPFDNVIVDLSYLSRNSPLRTGQRVVTSGLGGVFPKGILVGHIVDYRSVGYGLYNEARVKVAARMNALEEVWVVWKGGGQ